MARLLVKSGEETPMEEARRRREVDNDDDDDDVGDADADEDNDDDGDDDDDVGDDGGGVYKKAAECQGSQIYSRVQTV